MAAADAQQTETGGAPGSETPAPSPSPDTPKGPPRGRRFEPKSDDDVAAELRAKLAEQAATIAAQGARIDALEQSLQRLAEALGRADAILPVATAEQIKAAYDAGGKLKVLSPISRGTFVLQAGRVIEARHYRVEQLMDLARVGLLRLAVVPSASKAA
jgi:hypothetical protein